jgi:hypothetical protein
MALTLADDECLWAHSTATLDRPSDNRWSLSNGYFWVGEKPYSVHSSITSFELALFDTHYTYWDFAAHCTDSKESCKFIFNYHARIREAVESYFGAANESNLCSPKILSPWLWRTFCGCDHDQKGRDAFMTFAKKHGVWSYVCADTPSMDGTVTMQAFAYQYFN